MVLLTACSRGGDMASYSPGCFPSQVGAVGIIVGSCVPVTLTSQPVSEVRKQHQGDAGQPPEQGDPVTPAVWLRLSLSLTHTHTHTHTHVRIYCTAWPWARYVTSWIVSLSIY